MPRFARSRHWLATTLRHWLATTLALLSASLLLACAGAPTASRSSASPALDTPRSAVPLAPPRATPPTPPTHEGPEAVTPAEPTPADEAGPKRANADTDASAAKYAFQDPLPRGPLARSSPAFLFSSLSPAECINELRRRKLPVARSATAADGVAVPVRITGAMHGVRFVTPPRKSVFGQLDCRLALVLDELAKVLERRQVTSVRIDNFYRPHARLAGTRTRSQHRYGLAVDLVSFTLESGLELLVERDFGGALHTPPCGPESELSEPSERAILLRDLVCDVAKSGLFHHILTPNFNAAHRDHLHLDIKRGDTRWVVE